MNEKMTGINFGVGVFETKKGLDDEKIKAVVESIEKETREAGLPWWAGMFNPKIVELAEIKQRECKCAEKETTVKERGEANIRERMEAAKKENDALRDEAAAKRRERIERIERVDKVTMNALCHIEYCMSKVADKIGREGNTNVQIVELSESMAKLASEAAALRMSMGPLPSIYPPAPMGINNGK